MYSLFATRQLPTSLVVSSNLFKILVLWVFYVCINTNIASFSWYLVFLHYFLFEILGLLMSFSCLIALVVTFRSTASSISPFRFWWLFLSKCPFCICGDDYIVRLLWPSIMVNYTERFLNVNSFLHTLVWYTTEFCLLIYYLKLLL